jgi:hypothetical protein
LVISPAAPYEESVAQAIEITDGFFRNAFFASQSDQQAFGTTANRAANVKLGIQATATWQYERTQRGQGGIRFIDFMLELVDLGTGDARLFGMDIGGESGEDGTEVEEFVLDAFENDGEGGDWGKRCALRRGSS